ncbi:MAG TPA: OmpH family outer membrane protein [Phenylobacterium sp.]|uniref:OmpH family outer membrane protein n=1 Tax=Phenylobacterium sp. TaxID=1871053 RepID=UPI002B74432C|nr:OmpH family outer membrane protein [Phenylobacterium sp.]HSV02143.1 OmpH family outer membrane protein [Phenylobacterium sp.]
MTSKHVLTAGCAALGALAIATSASAQKAAAAPGNPGPVINGVCVINVEAAIGGSTVGKYVDSRMQQLVAQVKAELGGEQTTIQTEGKTLESQRATLDANTFEQRGSALQARYNELQRKAQQRDRELQATEQKAIGRISQEMEPIVHQAYAQKGCGLLLQRTAVVLANPAMDITPQVVAGLNAKITQFAFDREHLDQTAAAAPPPVTTVPTPARPAATRR